MGMSDAFNGKSTVFLNASTLHPDDQANVAVGMAIEFSLAISDRGNPQATDPKVLEDRRTVIKNSNQRPHKPLATPVKHEVELSQQRHAGVVKSCKGRAIWLECPEIGDSCNGNITVFLNASSLHPTIQGCVTVGTEVEFSLAISDRGNPQAADPTLLEDRRIGIANPSQRFVPSKRKAPVAAIEAPGWQKKPRPSFLAP